MQKINFKDLPDESTPLSAENLNKLQNNIENAIKDDNLEIHMSTSYGSSSTNNYYALLAKYTIKKPNTDISDEIQFNFGYAYADTTSISIGIRRGATNDYTIRSHYTNKSVKYADLFHTVEFSSDNLIVCLYVQMKSTWGRIIGKSLLTATTDTANTREYYINSTLTATKPTGTIKEIIDYLYYKPSEKVTIADIIANGFITGDSKNLQINLILDKRLDDISTITLNKSQLVVRGTNGYINDFPYMTTPNSLNSTDYSWSCVKRTNNSILITIIKKNSAFSNSVNNTPISVNFINLELSLS